MSSDVAEVPAGTFSAHLPAPPMPLPGEVRPDGPAPGKTDQAAEIADALMGLMRLYGSLKARVATSVDPEIAPLFLLVRLVKDGPKRAKDLAELMCADQSTVSRQVATLVKSGLIERRADPDDGRASILVPTDLGLERVREHFVNRGQAIEPIIADWPHEDRSHFLRLLQKYTGTLEVRRDDVLNTMTRSHASLRAAGTEHRTTPNASTERSN